MTEVTDKSVLMICEKCGYRENVPWSDLLKIRELYDLKEDDEDHQFSEAEVFHDMFLSDLKKGRGNECGVKKSDFLRLRRASRVLRKSEDR